MVSMEERLRAQVRQLAGRLVWRGAATQAEWTFATGLWRRLTRHTPVPQDELSALAAQAGLGSAHVDRLLAQAAELTGERAVAGYAGLSLNPHPHRLVASGWTLQTWCAFDPFFLVPALDVQADVETADPRSGASLRVSLSPGRVLDIDPPSSVLAFPECAPGDTASLEQIWSSFCASANLFEDADSATAWLDGRPAALLTPPDAFDLARSMGLDNPVAPS